MMLESYACNAPGYRSRKDALTCSKMSEPYEAILLLKSTHADERPTVFIICTTRQALCFLSLAICADRATSRLRLYHRYSPKLLSPGIVAPLSGVNVLVNVLNFLRTRTK